MNNQKLGFWVLTALVVGNMVGSGIFMLPRSLAEVASPGGVILAWVLTGTGVLLIALVFGNLSIRKPEMTGGPQIYAKALFKPGSQASILCGYLVSWGYWVANFTGNVAIITTFTGYLSTFFPILTSKSDFFQIGGYTVHVGNFLTFVVCSALLWFLHFIILKGVEGAGRLNLVATVAKVAGFILFIVVTLFAFEKSNIFPLITPVHDKAGQTVSLMGQINGAAVATLWAFVGVESAVVFSSRAKNKSDIKKATITGLLIATFIYLGITILVMGVLSHNQLIHSAKPLVDALSEAIGPSGAYILAALALISLFGATIGWILLSAEVPYQAEKQGLFIKIFGNTNKYGAPNTSLIITNAASQLFIFSTISSSISSAFDFVIFVATLAFLVPYLISTVYQLKLVLKGETYENQRKNRWVDGVIAGLATFYSLWVIKAGTADLKTFLFGVALLVFGIIFYPFVPKPGKE
ncbi:amino acid permease [Falsibacillus albus]|uniref:Amino acid permease n=1 Tax=Falsibacillus albus TaxID=2478915 RepID=A0A3L7K3L3_9BACI|nr:amino acid permease [Falsibacillus albus]RLQ96601.1 amino acid permease [Falsibacillus albus]